MYLEISRWVTLVASIAITYGLYDQALKIWRTKSVSDFTWTIIAAIVFNELAWLNYGFALKEWPVVVIGIASTPAAVIAASGYLKYKGR